MTDRTPFRAAITGVHGYLPADVLGNEELARLVDTTDAWITDRTGIKERRILKGEGLGTSHMAAEAGLPVSSHLAPEMSLSLLATLPNAKFLEVMPWSYPLYAEHIEVKDGYAVASERPGWGYALDQDALRRYAIN